MSNFKSEILEFIKSIGHDLILEMEKDISETEKTDLFIPEMNIAFKFHKIHEKKTNISVISVSKPAFKLIHIWEDQWIFHLKSNLNSL